MKRLSEMILAIAFAAAASSGWAGWNPQGWEQPPSQEQSDSTSLGGVFLLGALDVYRTLLSPIDGKRCPSYPSCSAYAVDAVRQEGAWWGSGLTAGRLLGEADEAAFAPKIYRDGEWLIYYPIDSDLAVFGRGVNAP